MSERPQGHVDSAERDAQRDARRPGELTLREMLRWTWRQLTSMRTALVLLLMLALAAILTTAAFVPQALHIIRHRETKAISLVMYVAFATGVAFWLLFGVLIHNWPIIVSNAITLVLTLAIVAMKLRYG